jgi:hypothetical protein
MKRLFFEKVGLLILLIIIVTSCKIVYKTADVNSTLSKSVNDVNTNYSSISGKISAMQNEYLNLNCKTDLPPFETAKKMSDDITNSVQDLLKLKNTINDEYKNFSTYSKGKSEIASGTVEWKKFKITKKNMKSSASNLQKKGEETIEKATAFNKFVTISIAPIVQFCDVAVYNTKFKETVDSLGKIQLALNAQLKKYEGQVNLITQQYAAKAEKCKSMQDDIKKMSEEKNRITDIKASIQLTVDQFKSKTRGRQKIYSCSADWVIVTQAESQLLAQQNLLNEIQQNIAALSAHIQGIVNTINN